MEKTARHSLQCPNCGANAAENSVRCEYCRAVLTVTACPSCFAPVFKGVRYCPDCGSAIARSEIDPDQKLLCPRCETLLAAADIAGTHLRECQRCGGIWLDAATFQAICDNRESQEKALLFPVPAAVADNEAALQSKRFYIPCPVCGGLMVQKNFAGCSGVVIDICKPHGLWFDRQELQRIVGFIKDGGLRKARIKEVEELREEKKNLEHRPYAGLLDYVNPDDEPAAFDLGDNGMLGSLASVLIRVLRKIT